MLTQIEKKNKLFYTNNINSIENLINNPIKNFKKIQKKEWILYSNDDIKYNKKKKKKKKNFNSTNAINEINEIINDIKETHFLMSHKKYNKTEFLMHRTFIKQSLNTIHTIIIGIMYQNYHNKKSDLDYIRNEIHDLDNILKEDKSMSENQ